MNICSTEFELNELRVQKFLAYPDYIGEGTRGGGVPITQKTGSQTVKLRGVVNRQNVIS